MSGKKGRSGCKKRPATVINDYLESIKTDELPDILKSMVEKAKAGDKELQIYLCDRVLGRPRQAIDQRIQALVLVTPDEYEMATRAVKEAESALLITAGAIKEG